MVSTGFVLDRDALPEHVAFRVNADGSIDEPEEIEGWSFVTSYTPRDFDEPGTYFVVSFEDSDEAREAMRGLIEEHVERFGACRVFHNFPRSTPVWRWARTGWALPETDDELMALKVSELRTRAVEAGLEITKSMKKAELVKALRAAQAEED